VAILDVCCPTEDIKPRLARDIAWWPSHIFWFPHPCQLLGSDLSPDEADRVARYLEGAPPIGSSYPGDRISRPQLGDSAARLDESTRFDGEWMFPASLGYYVRQGVRLPAPLLARIRQRDYHCPEDVWRPESGVEPDFGRGWVWWALTHTRPGLRSGLHWVRMVLALPLFLAFLLVAPWLRRRLVCG